MKELVIKSPCCKQEKEKEEFDERLSFGSFIINF
jgi:hypothetical protein